MVAPILPFTSKAIERAVAALKRGEVVAFATETVFGLGVDVFNPAAIEKIYEVKGRPAHLPLQILVRDSYAAQELADFSISAAQVAQEFWPGALTMVVPAKEPERFPVHTRSEQGIGLRAPDHPVPQALLAAFGQPLAATSANISGQPPAHSSEEVQEVLGKKVALILEGECHALSLPSTVVDASGETPCILREGGVSQASIEAVWNAGLLTRQATE